MNATVWRRLNEFIEARNPRERVILFGAVLVLLVYAWAMILFTPMYSRNVDLTNRIADMRAMMVTHNTRIAELNALLRGDPDSPIRSRQREMQEANAAADERLQQLYSQLIDPRQMAQMLTGILQRDTTLVLVGLENIAPELIHSANTTPDATASLSPDGNGMELFKHGLHMVFEGSFMETVRYLRSLEQLEENFYWENLEFSIQAYPNARISLDIYTLSTQEEWIGV